jgi:iron only hydrogenase large subunit-like protein
MKPPIYTEQAACQDCYKCVRECPVKAIEVNGGHAVVIHDLCIFCGHCVTVCPVRAKRMREDLPRAKQLLAQRSRSCISLAPSWVSEFDCSPGQIATALGKLGFAHAGETSAGAEIISAALRESGALGQGVHISTACPAVTELIEKYYPQHVPLLSPWKSPMLAHGLMFKNLYGSGTGVVFASPCIAKKLEADRNGTIVDVAVTFYELRQWFKDAGIVPAEEEEGQLEGSCRDGGSLYPVDGGMIASIRKGTSVVDTSMLSLSGTEAIMQSLDYLDAGSGPPLFLEFLACKGGCINGPCSSTAGCIVSKRLKIIRHASGGGTQPAQRQEPCMISREMLSQCWDNRKGVVIPGFSEEELEKALSELGKSQSTDRLNCGGCGYFTCRDFAAAWLQGKAEKAMCVASMRRLAQKKMSALIRTIPFGVVILDHETRIVECNRRFLEFFSNFSGEEIDEKLLEQMVGKPADRLLPSIGGIRYVQEGSDELLEKQVQHNGRTMKLCIFQIEPGRFTGALFEDVTAVTERREAVIKNAEAVISRNLSTVQQIAGLLGESAAETEVILSSLIETFNSGSDSGRDSNSNSNSDSTVYSAGGRRVESS